VREVRAAEAAGGGCGENARDKNVKPRCAKKVVSGPYHDMDTL